MASMGIENIAITVAQTQKCPVYVKSLNQLRYPGCPTDIEVVTDVWKDHNAFVLLELLDPTGTMVFQNVS
jgi:hypothetical protein